MTAVNISHYNNLFRLFRDQPVSDVFAHFHPEKDPLTESLDFDAPFKKIAAKTFEGTTAWDFTQARFQNRYHDKPPKLRNYLRYTFIRLRDLEIAEPGKYFLSTEDGKWICFNTGLQDRHSADLYSIFQRYEPRPGQPQAKAASDWVYRGTVTSRENAYRNHFGPRVPGLAWYSNDSRDYIFNTAYSIDADVFDHLFDRAKERSGFPDEATDESVRNYLRGAIENLIPKIRRNYKTAIPVYFVEEKRMQLLLPFHSSNGRDISCFLVERDDHNQLYKIKTILDMDQAYFAARLITRPDKEWLNP
jgi:Domain of unknown function (DUF3825)